MSISVLSNSGLLQFISSSSIAAPVSGFNTLPKVQESLENQVAANTSSAQLAEDAYTPSSQSSQTEKSSHSLVDSLSSSPGVSMAAMDAMADTMSNYVDPVYSSWLALNNNLAAGDISAAQASLTDYTNALASSYLSMSSLTAPTAAFMSDLGTLGKALNAGNLANAQAAFTTADYKNALTDNPAGLALAQAENDSGMTVQGLQNAMNNGTSLTFNSSKLAEDVKNLDDLARAENNTVRDYLVSKGFSNSDATAYATAVTSISNGSAAENANVDATRTTQWINALTNYVKSGTTPTWYVEAPTPGDPMFTAIAGIMNASSIAAWNKAHALAAATLGTSNTGSSASKTGEASVSAYA